jgi:hypothetical protein
MHLRAKNYQKNTVKCKTTLAEAVVSKNLQIKEKFEEK